MEFTLSMLMDTSVVQASNALKPSSVTPAGTSTCPFASGGYKQPPSAVGVTRTSSSRSHPTAGISASGRAHTGASIPYRIKRNQFRRWRTRRADAQSLFGRESEMREHACQSCSGGRKQAQQSDADGQTRLAVVRSLPPCGQVRGRRGKPR